MVEPKSISTAVSSSAIMMFLDSGPPLSKDLRWFDVSVRVGDQLSLLRYRLLLISDGYRLRLLQQRFISRWRRVDCSDRWQAVPMHSSDTEASAGTCFHYLRKACAVKDLQYLLLRQSIPCHRRDIHGVLEITSRVEWEKSAPRA